MLDASESCAQADRGAGRHPLLPRGAAHADVLVGARAQADRGPGRAHGLHVLVRDLDAVHAERGLVEQAEVGGLLHRALARAG